MLFIICYKYVKKKIIQLNMKNIINVDMSCFWINKENPWLVSYNPENTSEWTPIQSSRYLNCELVKPKQDEIAYRYKNNDYFGYLLKTT